ncbi:hypothetical protein ACIP6T_23360 [Pantoea sp. NPDC088449]|uniref:hypothetical protein n=1 Tax=Pantoea sp. NPDC088449 TaxID=3364392 RepID=UPI0037F2BB5F
MNKRTDREQRIRLCALQLRYRRAWQAKADSCQLATMLTEIEALQRRLAVNEVQPEAVCK